MYIKDQRNRVRKKWRDGGSLRHEGERERETRREGRETKVEVTLRVKEREERRGYK